MAERSDAILNAASGAEEKDMTAAAANAERQASFDAGNGGNERHAFSNAENDGNERQTSSGAEDGSNGRQTSSGVEDDSNGRQTSSGAEDDSNERQTFSDAGDDRNSKRTKFLTKDVVMCVVVLAAIALIAGVLLGVMNWVTYVDPEAAIMEQIAKYYGVAADDVTSVPERVVGGGSSYVDGCYAVTAEDGTLIYVYHAVGSGAKDGTLELLVHIAADGTIKEVEEYSQSETAGYFDRVISANRGKYVGKNAKDVGQFDLVKGEGSVTDDGDIDAVSQATLTSRGINNAVNAAVAAFNAYEEAAV